MMKLDFILQEKKKILVIFALLFFFEFFSFLSYYFPKINLLFFLIIVLVFFFLALYKLELALYVLLAELFVNSMGYLFFLELGSLKISLRIALWLIVMSVFLAKFILEYIKEKKVFLQKYLFLPNIKVLAYLFLFIFLGLIYGLINNGFSDAFFDFNAWLYFSLIFPLWQVIFVDKKADANNFWQKVILIFVGAVLFLVFKSLLFLFLFSHSLPGLIFDLYYWTRSYALGEITNMGSGFHRIFLQAQIFILLAFLFSSVYLIFIKNKKRLGGLILFLSLLASGLILSFSRSFWMGGIIAIIVAVAFLIRKFNIKTALRYLSLLSLSLVIGFLFVLVVVKFPWPQSRADFSLDSLSNRAKIISSESAISSRWALLDVMQGDIKNNFVLGRGFGARLEYKSNDSRVLERTTDGIHSTYAFEWGWIDIWLKLGLFGVLVYLLLIFNILKYCWVNFRDNDKIYLVGLGLAIISLAVVNFFTPYLNHPLGIGFLILSNLFLYQKFDRSLC